MDVDQAAIDQILASAEADTPESRLDKLEKELEVLKGSVKKLLLDLRETLNNLENPFQNLQNLAEVTSLTQQPPQIQVVPAQLPEPKKDEKKKEEERKGEEEEEGEEEKREELAEERDEIVEDVDLEEAESMTQTQKLVPVEAKRETKPEKRFEDAFRKFDIATLFNLMEWVKCMLDKYSLDSLRLMLELFEAAGYISEEKRNFICKVAELVAVNNGFEDMILELYRLHKLMNPSDTSMDSKLLTLILEKRL